MRIVRTSFASALLVALIAMTVAAVMARAALAADGQLCSVASGPTVVLAADGLPLFDASGEPVMMDRPVCPDVIVKALAIDLSAPLTAWAGDALDVDAPEVETPLWADLWRLGGQGRGPPRAA